MEELFLTAISSHFRFNVRGSITTEDLFNLCDDDLRKLYHSLKAEAATDDDPFGVETKKARVASLKLKVVTAVIEHRKALRVAAEESAQRSAIRQRALAVKAKREAEALEELSDEELDKLIGV